MEKVAGPAVVGNCVQRCLRSHLWNATNDNEQASTCLFFEGDWCPGSFLPYELYHTIPTNSSQSTLLIDALWPQIMKIMETMERYENLKQMYTIVLRNCYIERLTHR